ncbi:MC/SLC25 family protein [Legionella bononiensis]|uniref:Mitochondrial carrier protein n=1 Tax=Legionella bononiensis TaxID=2793102 RepID=A0ABS1W8G2_9GAMM|nr:MC/SLC25 family protein [Legionella bononiensis]MBL7479832.1 hypothetical protein [Legionella bononiensis]MBL7525653.1 hypothetical protein [Legionella bononiensis]MBL7561836.1 hypothetical protein [Legionella bononiensis]
MHSRTDRTELPTWKKYLQYPFIQGPLLGAGVMTLVTPGLNWTNHVLNGKTMQWRFAMSGSFEYASSAIPSYAVVFVLKKLMQPENQQVSPLYEFATSFTAGAFSGLASTPFEGIAQNKQLSKLTTSQETRHRMIMHHGYNALFQGGFSIMLREGLWSTVYLTAIPTLARYFKSTGMKKEQAEGLALVLTAGSYGFFSTPLYQLRFRKQQGLTEPVVGKSYLQHAKDIWNQPGNGGTVQRLGFFFKGALPRTLTTTIAGALLYKGQEILQELIKPSKP